MIEGDLILFREGFSKVSSLKLSADEFSHAKALRLDKGEHLIDIRDGIGNSFLYLIQPGHKELSFQSERILPEEKKNLTIAIALPKGNRLDFFIQKVTEIGIRKIIFCVFRHSIRKEFNIERAKKIVSEAASQSKQPVLLQMEITDALTWIETEKDNITIFDPHSNRKFVTKDVLDRIPVIGPEGGFHADEIMLMEKHAIRRVKWEGGVLRTETAGIVAASLLAYGV